VKDPRSTRTSNPAPSEADGDPSGAGCVRRRNRHSESSSPTGEPAARCISARSTTMPHAQRRTRHACTERPAQQEPRMRHHSSNGHEEIALGSGCHDGGGAGVVWHIGDSSDSRRRAATPSADSVPTQCDRTQQRNRLVLRSRPCRRQRTRTRWRMHRRGVHTPLWRGSRTWPVLRLHDADELRRPHHLRWSPVVFAVAATRRAGGRAGAVRVDAPRCRRTNELHRATRHRELRPRYRPVPRLLSRVGRQHATAASLRVRHAASGALVRCKSAATR
jgi:hypothetical protein